MTGIRISAWALGLSLLLAATAQAQTTLSKDNDPSLILLIWDPVNKVSYSRDTGLLGSTLYDQLSDAGSQQFWTLDPAVDTNFKKFVDATDKLDNDLWMVIGGGKAGSGNGPGKQVVFTTMKNTTANGVLNPQWDFLTKKTNLQVRSQASNFETNLYTALEGGNSTGSSYASAPSGFASSFDTASSNAYVGNLGQLLGDIETGLSGGEAMFGGADGFDTGNALGAGGSSSWFYYMTPSDLKTNSISTVSAFANSAYDAYWGLARTTNTGGQQELVLSFTMQASVTSTTTAAGAVRRNQTDYTAGYGIAKPISTPGGEFAGWVPSSELLGGGTVSAVPEPTSALLMALGLGGLVAATRRHRRG
ncbi:PEP-CTERM sorting domain-containing protein [Paucibacter sp. R3-3]|uniref:PEP-CTERM sorting domain-containing protein n=1 Tax=Roseateles agri TaxID=3098619 RepID=A0ABU5DCA5_9BURK|nr:PEP-CTERM sorting domain-containing protein [Paucibacter sp. R3-3]MDY0743328.1 PEP-CTERM sorting domain-containing protein [Paucibacter sp. R3-3]